MPSFKTFLTVKNSTRYSIVTQIRSVDNYDWDGGSRPDKNFHNVTIKPGESVNKREEINTFATANMYTMDIHVNGERVICRIDQGIASNRCKEFQEYLPIQVVKEAEKGFAPVKAANVSGIAESACKYADKIYTRKQHYERGFMEVTPSPSFNANIRVIGNNVTVEVLQH